MKELFLIGGLWVMSILTLLLVIMLAWYIYQYIAFRTKSLGIDRTHRELKFGRSIGLFALITGILGQMIGLYQAFFAIERAADISPILIFGGLKVSMISTIYGMLIYLFSLLLWFILSFMVDRR